MFHDENYSSLPPGCQHVPAFCIKRKVSKQAEHAVGPLIRTSWGQRWAYAAYAPPANGSAVKDGLHERLGCWSTALGQVMHFHRLCPSGAEGYSAPGFNKTSMDFDKEAEHGLCDWSSFADTPPNTTTSAATMAVAHYLYAAAIVLQKKWGTGDYMLSHSERAKAISKHFPVSASISSLSGEGNVSRASMKLNLKADLDRGWPAMLHIGSRDRRGFHDVAIDGYMEQNSQFMVHLNVGHSGFDNGWYDFDGEICLHHYPNGTIPAKSHSRSCAHLYDDVSYREVLHIHPRDSEEIPTDLFV
eukprot:gnl/TRDRNA2_/TRDRNA2_111653_c1_seq1.p1 gnl/TRDRNA2_/TRDRNA2_111653_c1~~gnl/TRDRNA2_/TRDRNA2_111653_c1_seq1.p1  ORF type:complete len:330 (+),score=27.80 gnl/TRDRNA2_/TRDRNA2_111653_c1_seq1:88-990(+)